MTSKEILDLLAEKHSRDVFVPECKDGPTQGSKHFRMDAWAMAKSWAHPKLTAYEIKVSRADFLKDRKWHEYLTYCNEFYFVAPKGLIKLDELHEGVGLIEVASNGKCLRTILKPRFREIEFPETVFTYVLMCRAQIGTERGMTEDPVLLRAERMEIWRKWLAQEEEGFNLGHRVSARIAEYVRKVEDENRRLKSLMERYDGHREQLREIGCNPDNAWGHELTSRIAKAQSAVPPWVERAISSLESNVASLKKEFVPDKKENVA